MSGYLINTVTIQSNKMPQKVVAGTLVSASDVITAVQAAGGVLGSATDATLIASAAAVAKLRSRGGNEEACNLLMLAGYEASISGAALQHVVIDVPLATIKAQTSAAAFNVGSVLPANARVVDSELTVLQVLGGGSISAAAAKVQGGTDTAGSMIGGGSGSDVHAALAVFGQSTGSDAYASRGGQQIKMTLTSTGDTLANATTGHLQLDLYYNVVT